MHRSEMPDDLKEQLSYAFTQIKNDRERYFNWIKDEIETVINLINKYDKIYVLGAIAAKLLENTPSAYDQIQDHFQGTDVVNLNKNVDEEIEVVLEYAINIATATANENVGIIPANDNIQEIINQLVRIKTNINLFEISNEISPEASRSDQWLRSMTIQNSLNVRGEGYQNHIELIYQEVFGPFDQFLTQYYGFNSNEIHQSIKRLDYLVYSKISNELGAFLSHKRFVEWSESLGDSQLEEEMNKSGKHFMEMFIDANPDLRIDGLPGKVGLHPLDSIESVNKIFKIVPACTQERKIYEQFSIEFGANKIFFEPEKFKAFPLNDSNIYFKPILKFNDEFYCFSLALPHRNMFKISENLIENADAVYHQHVFRGNSSSISKDNYIEQKTKKLFEKLLPNVNFFHSLKYKILEDGLEKNPELDIIGIGASTIYIIEVKAGQLTTKHKRGALKGLKDRIKETINEGSYQCHRALQYINDNTSPVFDYISEGKSEQLTINKSPIKKFVKISVTFEHYSLISINLKELIDSGLLNHDYKWTWIVSLYDLMVFSDIIESEQDFLDYLNYRIDLYDRSDITFVDEIDILGFFLDGNFPLKPFKKDENNIVTGYSKSIDDYYTKLNLSPGTPLKPKRKIQGST